MAPKAPEKSMTYMGTQVKLRDQLKRKVRTATVMMTRSPPMTGVEFL